MTVTTWTDEAGNTYSGTTIPEKIVGFSGIDPVFIPKGWSASPPSGTGSGDDTSPSGETQDHEKLQRLLGGGTGEGDHYHLDHWQHHIFEAILDLVFPRDGSRPLTQENIEIAAKALRGE